MIYWQSPIFSYFASSKFAFSFLHWGRDSGNDFGRFSVSFFEGRILYILKFSSLIYFFIFFQILTNATINTGYTYKVISYGARAGIWTGIPRVQSNRSTIWAIINWHSEAKVTFNVLSIRRLCLVRVEIWMADIKINIFNLFFFYFLFFFFF